MIDKTGISRQAARKELFDYAMREISGSLTSLSRKERRLLARDLSKQGMRSVK